MNPSRRYRANRSHDFAFENLETRQLLAGITFDAVSGVVNIQGSPQGDAVWIFSSTSTMTKVEFIDVETVELPTDEIALIQFFGHDGNDSFFNNTDLPSFAAGHRGNDSLSGGNNSDILYGGQGNDVVMGFGGDDELRGQDGDDRVIGGSGNDIVSGADGNDTLGGTSEDDVLYGGSGSDRINGGAGNDRLFGQAGDDIISDTNGDDEIYGNEGNDWIFGRSGQDKLVGGVGNDFLSGGYGDDQVFGGDGDDRIEGNQGRDLIFGGRGNDRLEGNDQGDTIFGGDGNDTIDGGGGGMDILYGQDGDDHITGGEGFVGHNQLYGGNGNDHLVGGHSFDLIVGSHGRDFIEGGYGNDEIFGGPGADEILGGPGNDLLAGLGGNDFIGGGQGDDTILGGDGNDYLRGAADNDILRGGNGHDRLYGMQGNDQLFGDQGNDGLSGGPAEIENPDVLQGGLGSDRYLRQGADSIVGFQSIDVIVDLRSSNSLIWSHGEIQTLDTGLQQLHLRTGNRNLLTDPSTDRPIVIEKVETLNPSLHTGRNTFDFAVRERKILFEGFDHFNEETAKQIPLELIREIGLSWASNLAISNRLPNQSNYFSQFEAISSWTDGPVQDPDNFIASDDGTQFYSASAAFADDALATRNSREDFASIWRLSFDSDSSIDGLQSKLSKIDELFSLLS